MESQPQNPEFRNFPENFHRCIYGQYQNLKNWPLSYTHYDQTGQGKWGICFFLLNICFCVCICTCLCVFFRFVYLILLNKFDLTQIMTHPTRNENILGLISY